MNTTSGLQFKFRDASQLLIRELQQQLCEGVHLAIVAPRQSGKAILLHELRRLALLQEKLTPRVVVLRALDFKIDSSASFLEELRQCLIPGYLTTEIAADGGTDLSVGIVELFKEASQLKVEPLWLFVQSILEFPASSGRALLRACQHASEETWAKSRFSVVVTGCHDFIPLTSDQNSPYRHANKYFLFGLDRELTRGYFEARVRGDSIFDGFKWVDGRPAATLGLDESALDCLYEHTGGYARFIEEAVLTANRLGPDNLRPRDSGWSRSVIDRIIERFVVEYLPIDPYVRLTLSEIERDSTSWDLLGDMLQPGGNGPKASMQEPLMLESSGIARRDGSGMLRIGSLIWGKHLNRIMSNQYRADVLALQSRWDEAWLHYEKCFPADCDRPLDGKSRYYWRDVVRHWEESLSDQAAKEPRVLSTAEMLGVVNARTFEPMSKVWDFFSKGMRYLYGMSAGFLTNPPNEPPLKFIDFRFGEVDHSVGRILNSIANSDEVTPDLDEIVAVHAGRLSVHSRPKELQDWLKIGVGPLLWLERRQGCEIDVILKNHLRKSLLQFWTAIGVALRRTLDAELGVIRERHLNVVGEVTQLAGKRSDVLRNVIQGSARALVEVGGYFRVLISLVDPSGSKIQGIAGFCEDCNLMFRERLESSLAPLAAGEKPDLYRWVVLNNRHIAIADATCEDNSEIRIDHEWATTLEMKGLAVIPIVIRGESNRVVEILGTLHVERRDKLKPDDSEVMSLGILAGQLATAFDHARRTDLLEQALDRVDTQFRVLSRDSRVIYRNKAASKSDNQPFRTWHYPLAPCPLPLKAERLDWPVIREVLENPEKYPDGNNRFYEQSKPARVWEDFAAPLTDFRSNLPHPFQADGHVGAVHQATELTDFQQMSMLPQKLLSDPDLRNAADRVIAFLQERQCFEWARLYLLRETSNGDVLESFAEFGLPETSIKQRFVGGGFTIPRTRQQRPVWLLLDELRKPAVFEHMEATLDGRPVPNGEFIPGIPLFFTNDMWRLEFQKKDQRWLEAPLLVGERPKGLIAVSMPKDLSPRFYERFRLWCTCFAWVFYVAGYANEEARKARREGEEAAVEMAIHQLSNGLAAGEAACAFAKEDMQKTTVIQGDVREQVLRDISVALESFAQTRLILRDFSRYAGDRPFEDEECIDISELVIEIEAQLAQLFNREASQQYPDVEVAIDPDPVKCKVKTSRTALQEVCEILARNSIRHAKSSGRLRLTLTAEVDKLNRNVCNLIYTDNGVGVHKGLKEWIFEPFVTTNDQGSGLGLAIARRLLKQVRGTIREVGQHGAGVRFELGLPVEVNDKNPGLGGV